MNDSALATVDHGAGLDRIETATAAQSALVRAQVEARYLVAMKVPRNLDQVRVDLLRDCKRPGFAEESLYELPFGRDKVRGLSIRFAEAALDHMGNCDIRTVVVFEDDERVILNSSVTDLQRNTSYSVDLQVSKTSEKRHVKQGEQVLGQRLNSYGDTVYIVPASEHDLRRKIGAEVSKAIRTNGLRLVPAWLKEECLKRIHETLRRSAADDPDAAKRKLVDGFAAIGIKPRDLHAYLGHDLDGCSPDELVELRAVYVAVRDGQCRWGEAMAARTGVEGDAEDDPHADIREKIAAVKDRLKDNGDRKSDPGSSRGKGGDKSRKSGGSKRGRGRAKRDEAPEPESPPSEPDEQGDVPPAEEPEPYDGPPEDYEPQPREPGQEG